MSARCCQGLRASRGPLRDSRLNPCGSNFCAKSVDRGITVPVGRKGRLVSNRRCCCRSIVRDRARMGLAVIPPCLGCAALGAQGCFRSQG